MLILIKFIDYMYDIKRSYRRGDLSKENKESILYTFRIMLTVAIICKKIHLILNLEHILNLGQRFSTLFKNKYLGLANFH